MVAVTTRRADDSWSILCDFDGTVTLDDVVDGLLQQFGLAGWQALEDDWRAGIIGSRECMQRQVALLDVSPGELDHYLDTVQIDPDFGEFVAAARRRGYSLSIVSDGIDYVIQRILQRHQLSDVSVSANRLLPASVPRRWQLESPFEVADCPGGTCKCALVHKARAQASRRVLLIGDGRSDFCASAVADLVFAKAQLIDLCQAGGLAHLPVAGFRAALNLLPQLDSLEPARSH